MTTATSKGSSEAQIRALMDDRAKAARAKDVDRILSHFAPDVRSFEFEPPLQIVGSAAVRKACETGYSAFQGSFDYEVSDLHIAAGDDVAFCHSLNRIGGTTMDGERTEMWARETVCFRKIDGQWKIAHQHLSVPLDAESGAAAVDLEP